MYAKVSVIILNWNSKKWLGNCLTSILEQSFAEDIEVLLVDNGSIDDSVMYVRHRFPQVKIIELGENLGFAEGNNRALKYAQGEYLLFVNTDTEAEEGWLRNLVNAADRHPEYQILCSIQIPSQGQNRARVLNAYGNPMPSPYESELAITDSLFASGACFLIRRKWLDHVGGLFDPHYCYYAEDLELSLRTILLGGQIAYVKNSRIYHYGGGASLSSPVASYFSTRNILLTYYRLFELRNFVKILSVRVVYIIMRLFARKQQLLNTVGMVKGVIGFLFDFRRYINDRRTFLIKKKRDDAFILERLVHTGNMEKMVLRKLYGG